MSKNLGGKFECRIIEFVAPALSATFSPFPRSKNHQPAFDFSTFHSAYAANSFFREKLAKTFVFS